MNQNKKILILSFLIITALIFVIVFIPKKVTSPISTNSPIQTPSINATNPTPTPSEIAPTPIEEPNGLIEPVVNFKSRVTKKPFGIYVTPSNSPVQPEKFTGFHTGADAEYGDVDSDTPLYAVSDGTIEYSGHVNGYGGVLVINQNINGQNTLCLYGHVAVSSIPPKGTTVTKGQSLGRLGHAYSSETDGERKHLHFAMIKENSIDFRGYVQTQSELDNWYDPLTFFTK
jgi:murein DD-endopeptidase MepM/ murein hydrolase activator NlpD